MTEESLIKKLNTAWKWFGVSADKIIDTNDFGNIIFKSSKNTYWRICPEELTCMKIADSDNAYENLTKEQDFLEDWNMENLTREAIAVLGQLEENEKFCLKIPGVIGGEYVIENLGKIDFFELISFSGDLAFKIKDLNDGQNIRIEIKN